LLGADPQAIHRLLRNRFAIDRATLLRERAAGRVHTFTVVREPLARFASFHEDKILNGGWERGIYPRLRRAYGLRPGDSLERVADVVRTVPDDEAEIHFRSQFALTHHLGEPMVDRVFRVESLSPLWSWLETRVLAAGGGWSSPGVRLNATGGGTRVRGAAVRSLLRERYADDLRCFYPGEDTR
jgi:hypothetical protein